jgi:serine protease inhibitor ecotin
MTTKVKSKKSKTVNKVKPRKMVIKEKQEVKAQEPTIDKTFKAWFLDLASFEKIDTPASIMLVVKDHKKEIGISIDKEKSEFILYTFNDGSQDLKISISLVEFDKIIREAKKKNLMSD